MKVFLESFHGPARAPPPSERRRSRRHAGICGLRGAAEARWRGRDGGGDSGSSTKLRAAWMEASCGLAVGLGYGLTCGFG